MGQTFRNVAQLSIHYFIVSVRRGTRLWHYQGQTSVLHLVLVLFGTCLALGNNLIAETFVHHILSSFRNLDYFEFISELDLRGFAAGHVFSVHFGTRP